MFTYHVQKNNTEVYFPVKEVTNSFIIVVTLFEISTESNRKKNSFYSVSVGKRRSILPKTVKY